MAPKPLDVLKKGLAKFSNCIKDRKDELTTKLSRKETISSADEKWPTQREVLKAVSTIGRYTADLNDPILCKIEGLLGLFNRQLRLEETHSMQMTQLTDFFRRV